MGHSTVPYTTIMPMPEPQRGGLPIHSDNQHLSIWYDALTEESYTIEDAKNEMERLIVARHEHIRPYHNLAHTLRVRTSALDTYDQIAGINGLDPHIHETEFGIAERDLLDLDCSAHDLVYEFNLSPGENEMLSAVEGYAILSSKKLAANLEEEDFKHEISVTIVNCNYSRSEDKGISLEIWQPGLDDESTSTMLYLALADLYSSPGERDPEISDDENFIRYWNNSTNVAKEKFISALSAEQLVCLEAVLQGDITDTSVTEAANLVYWMIGHIEAEASFVDHLEQRFREKVINHPRIMEQERASQVQEFLSKKYSQFGPNYQRIQKMFEDVVSFWNIHPDDQTTSAPIRRIDTKFGMTVVEVSEDQKQQRLSHIRESIKQNPNKLGDMLRLFRIDLNDFLVQE